MKSIRLLFLCLAFITGLLLGYNFTYPEIYGGAAIAMLLVVTVYLGKYRAAFTFNFLPWPCISAIYLCVVMAGAAQIGFSVNQNQKPLPAGNYCKFKILGAPVPTSGGNLKCMALLTGVLHNGKIESTNTRIQVIILKPSGAKGYYPGQYFFAPAKLKGIEGPKNPYQFNYQQLLARQGIYKALLVPEELVVFEATNTFYERARLVPYILHRTVTNYFKAAYRPRVAQVLSALIAGENQVDAEVRQDFQNTGTIHALSVSGMHVTMFSALLFFVLSPIRRYRTGELVIFIIIALALAVYALFTGLSPSVLRAVLMLLLYMAARILKLKLQPINVIALACLIQLVANPYNIYSAGFQLSYLAVTGIALFYPILARRITTKNKALRACLSLVALSLSAQAFTTPYAAYLFHTVPWLALPANLLIQLPLVFVMYGGFLSAILHWPVIVVIVQKACLALLGLLSYLARIDGAALTNVNLTVVQCLLLMAFASLALYMASPGNLKLKVQWATVVLSAFLILEAIKTQPPEINKAVFFSTAQGYCVYVPHDKQPLLLTDLPTGSPTYKNNVKPCLSACNIAPVLKPYNCPAQTGNMRFANHQLLIANKLLLVVDSAFTQQTMALPMSGYDYAWIKHSNYYVINNKLTPRAIIIDGTNSYSCMQSYISYCAQKRIPLINVKTGMYFTI